MVTPYVFERRDMGSPVGHSVKVFPDDIDLERYHTAKEWLTLPSRALAIYRDGKQLQMIHFDEAVLDLEQEARLKFYLFKTLMRKPRWDELSDAKIVLAGTSDMMEHHGAIREAIALFNGIDLLTGNCCVE